MTSLSLPESEIDLETLVFDFTITFHAVIPAPGLAHALPSSFFVTFFSLPPLECLAGAVDGAVLRELLRASGGGGREGSRAGTGAGRPGAGCPAW